MENEIINRGKKYSLPFGISFMLKDHTFELFYVNESAFWVNIRTCRKLLKAVDGVFDMAKEIAQAKEQVLENADKDILRAVKEAYEKKRSEFTGHFLRISAKENMEALARLAETVQTLGMSAAEYFDTAVAWRKTWKVAMDDFPNIAYFASDKMVNGVMGHAKVAAGRVEVEEKKQRFEEIKSTGKTDPEDLTDADLDYAAMEYAKQGFGVLDVNWLRKEFERRGMDYKKYKKHIVRA